MNRRLLLKFLGLAPVAAVVPNAAAAPIPIIDRAGEIMARNFPDKMKMVFSPGDVPYVTLGQWLDEMKRAQDRLLPLGDIEVDLHGSDRTRRD